MARASRAARKPFVSGPGVPVVVGNDETPEEREAHIQVAQEERFEQFQYDHDIEAQKADGLADIEERLAMADELADKANAGRPVGVSTGDSEVTFIDGETVSAEGEPIEEGTGLISFVNLGGDRAPGEGEPYDTYNTISGQVHEFDISNAPSLVAASTIDGVQPYTLNATKGRFGEHDTPNKWPLTAACGIEIRKWHQDIEPKRFAIMVHTPNNGEKMNAMLPNQETANAYMQDLEALITG